MKFRSMTRFKKYFLVVLVFRFYKMTFEILKTISNLSTTGNVTAKVKQVLSLPSKSFQVIFKNV